MEDFYAEMQHVRQLLEESDKTNYQVQVKIGNANHFGINVPPGIQDDGFYVKVKPNKTISFLKIFIDANGYVILRVGDGQELGKKIFDFNLNDPALISNVLINSPD